MYNHLIKISIIQIFVLTYPLRGVTLFLNHCLYYSYLKGEASFVENATSQTEGRNESPERGGDIPKFRVSIVMVRGEKAVQAP